MKVNLVALVLSLIFLITIKSEAQTTRWYSYAGEYLANDTSVDYQLIYLWNDTTGLFGYSGPPDTYSLNNFTSVGSSFAPVLPAWNNVPLYGSTIKVGPNDAYTIDSVRLYGAYLRNNARPLPKDTLRLGFVYGNGAGTTNMPDYFLFGPAFLADYGYDTLNFPEMPHDSLHNAAGNYTGVATLPYIQSIVLGVADTSSAFDKAYALSTPFVVPAGNNAAMSLTFKSGDPSYTHFDTVGYASGSVKYGEFEPVIAYVENSGTPVFAPYSPTDSNVGYFKQEGAADGLNAGLYSPTWTWSTSIGTASFLQYPVIDFHINCPTCDLSDTITGTMHICAGATTTLAHSLTGGTWSSSSTSAATVSGAGVVHGVAGGVVTITYNLSGHHAYTSFTVDALPAAISGTAHVCDGATTTLAESATGGTWSSGGTGVATVSAGVVGGMTPGTAAITYTLATGCATTTIVTVNTTPAAISTSTSFCAGSTITLTDGTTGGTWSSGATTAATVISGTGVVTGVSSSTAIITYALGTGCSATTVVTVNALPAAISTSAAFCAGSTITLTDGTTGGTWSSGATTIATIVGGTGVVTGVSGGTSTITYSLGTGCRTTTIVTANTNPAAISTSTSFCAGSTITLTDGTTGGTWSSGTTSVATVISGTGVVTGVSSSTATITYALGTGCSAATVVTVNALPAISTSTAFCAGSTITLTDGTTGGTWSSGVTTIATIASGTGVVTGVTGGTSTITYSRGTGCTTATIITVNTTPVAISTSVAFCAGSTITLTDGTTGGIWASGGATVATVGSGTGVVTGVSSSTTVVIYALGTGCSATTVVTVNALPAAISTSTSFCTASTITLTDGTTGGTWSSGATTIATIVSGTGVVTGVLGGTSTITYALGTGCAATTIVTANTTPAAISTSTAFCTGSTITLTDGTTGGSWTSGSTAVATVVGSTGVVTGGAVAGTSNIAYVLLTGCYTTAIVTVQTPAVAGTITGASTVCPGSTISLSDGVTGGSWSSGTAGTATVNSTGTVTGIAAGSVTISYSVTNSCGTANAPYGITVEPNPNAGTVTAASGDSVCVAATITLADLSTGGTWSSSNTLVATVDAGGNVTGAAAGADNITYTVTNSCGAVTAHLPITVLSALECSELGTASVNGNAAELKIYPNPNHGAFNVNLLSNSSEQVRIIITNIVGEKVQEINTTSNKLTSIILNAPQGMYVLSATTSTGNYVAKLIIE